jgi:hypothetical protein
MRGLRTGLVALLLCFPMDLSSLAGFLMVRLMGSMMVRLGWSAEYCRWLEAKLGFECQPC